MTKFRFVYKLLVKIMICQITGFNFIRHKKDQNTKLYFTEADFVDFLYVRLTMYGTK